MVEIYIYIYIYLYIYISISISFPAVCCVRVDNIRMLVNSYELMLHQIYWIQETTSHLTLGNKSQLELRPSK